LLETKLKTGKHLHLASLALRNFPRFVRSELASTAKLSTLRITLFLRHSVIVEILQGVYTPLHSVLHSVYTKFTPFYTGNITPIMDIFTLFTRFGGKIYTKKCRNYTKYCRNYTIKCRNYTIECNFCKYFTLDWLNFTPSLG
jgi:hypothetical protein